MTATITVTTSSAATTKADALVIGVVKGAKGLALAPGSADVAKAFGKGLLPALAGLGATGAKEEVTRLATLGHTKAPALVAVGLGETFDHEVLRRAAGAAVRSLAGASSSVLLALPAEDAAAVRAVAEGALLAAYAFTSYRQASLADQKAPVSAVIVASGLKDAKKVVQRAAIVAGAVNLARDLVNMPPSHLHPIELAGIAADECGRVGVAVEVLDEKALKKGGYGGILGVGQGSTHPPRLIRLGYTHPKAKQTVVLVGKGITFDSGGLSIKPAQAMEWMKSDMGGAAAVIATMGVLAALKPAVNVVGYAPTAENMPSGSAIRPSDVLKTYAGRTVEVLNTDA
ncbi:MAG: M17 family metallopeptidase, partial [Mycobacteriales bacterium]